jgi:hypothetical protein
MLKAITICRMSHSFLDNMWIFHAQDRTSGKLVCEMKANLFARIFGPLHLEALSKRCNTGQYAYSTCACWPIETPPNHGTSIPRHSLHIVKGVIHKLSEVLALPKALLPTKCFVDFVRYALKHSFHYHYIDVNFYSQRLKLVDDNFDILERDALA